LSSKRDAAEHLGLTTGKDSQPRALEARKASENEEWAWMVDEDPAFYLAKPGRAKNTGV